MDSEDQSRRSEAVLQAQRLGVVGHLAAAAAHELSNLLTVIVGRAEQIATVVEGEPALTRLAETIRSAGERGAELNQLMLNLSSPTASRPCAVDCAHLIGRLRPLMRRLARQGVEVRFELSEVPEIQACPGDVEAALLSAVLQAQESLSGGGTLTVGTSKQIVPRTGGQGQDCVVISIVEKGTDPRRIAAADTTGARLATDLMRYLVEGAGWDLVVEGEAGRDRSSRICLPLAVHAPRASAPPPLPEAATRLVRPKATLLVVEDDPFVRSYAIACLESLGYRVVPAADGQEALTHLEQGLQPDVLFTDVVMPGAMNGWQVAARAQELRPGLKVLFTTGYAVETLEEQGRLDPSIRILHKPYGRADLTRHMRDLLAPDH